MSDSKSGFKFNWGHGISLAIITFAILMGILAYSSIMSPTNLVREDYYEAELAYSDRMEAEVRGREIHEPKVEWDGRKLSLIYPSDYSSVMQDPHILIYSPSNPKEDRNIPFKWKDGVVEIALQAAPHGLVYIEVHWEIDSGSAFQRLPYHFPM